MPPCGSAAAGTRTSSTGRGRARRPRTACRVSRLDVMRVRQVHVRRPVRQQIAVDALRPHPWARRDEGRERRAEPLLDPRERRDSAASAAAPRTRCSSSSRIRRRAAARARSPTPRAPDAGGARSPRSSRRRRTDASANGSRSPSPRTNAVRSVPSRVRELRLRVARCAGRRSPSRRTSTSRSASRSATIADPQPRSRSAPAGGRCSRTACGDEVVAHLVTVLVVRAPDLELLLDRRDALVVVTPERLPASSAAAAPTRAASAGRHSRRYTA